MRGTLLLAAAIALSLLGCAARDVAPYQATLDNLGLTPDWHVTKTIVVAQGGPDGCVELINGRCPSITQYFVASGQLPALIELVKERASAGGFANINVSDPTCSAQTSSIAPACFLSATKEDMALDVTVYRPGIDVDGLGISVPDQATVQIVLHHN